jgi:hypothetical protein
MYIHCTLTLSRAVIKKDVDVGLGVIFTAQMTNSKERGAPAVVEAPTSPAVSYTY